ncbi:GRIP and coiled-coil domain-containing protein 2-like [Artemia franciscana]
MENKQKEEEVQLSLKTSITNYEEQLAELRKKLESNETEKTMLSATITQLQSQMDGLQTEIADWAAKCEKISGTLLSTKENNHRKIRCLEERIRSLEGEKKTLESQIDHLEHEFSDYKAKAHSIIKQSSTVGVVPRHDSVSEAEQERLHKAIEVLKERIEDLNTKLASSSLEYLNITEEKEKQSARDEKLLRAAELRILKLSEEISTLKEEFKVSTARLQGENQALVILHQERFSTMHAEHRLVQDSLRRQIQDLEVEISSLKASKISEVEVESRPEAIVPVPSLVERGQGEGSESSVISQSRFSPMDRTKERKQSEFFSLDKLLSSDLPDGDAKFEGNETSLVTEIEKLQTSLNFSEKKIQHLSSLLTESEKNEVRLNSLVEALKEEIRRVRRSQERQEHAENLEYLKNIIVKFVTLPRGEEKCRLIPVLQTILRLSPEEVQSITMSVKGPDIGNKASGYLNFGIWPLPK